jgi:hypothetical protein
LAVRTGDLTAAPLGWVHPDARWNRFSRTQVRDSVPGGRETVLTGPILSTARRQGGHGRQWFGYNKPPNWACQCQAKPPFIGAQARFSFT